MTAQERVTQLVLPGAGSTHALWPRQYSGRGESGSSHSRDSSIVNGTENLSGCEELCTQEIHAERLDMSVRTGGGARVAPSLTEKVHIMKRKVVNCLSMGIVLLCMSFSFAVADCTHDFMHQLPYGGDCFSRPQGSVCIGFDDGYTWLVFDAIAAWRHERCHGQQVTVAIGVQGEYHHIVGTDLIKFVAR